MMRVVLKYWKVLLGAVLIVSLLAAGWFVTSHFGLLANQGEHTISSSELTQAIETAEVFSAQHFYSGIVELPIGDKQKYHAAYEATVNVGIKDINEIKFVIDDEKNTVTVIFPSITAEDPVIDPRSLDYLPEEPRIGIDQVVKASKKSVLDEICIEGNLVNANHKIYEVATENLQDIMSELIAPIVNSKSYQIQFQFDAANKSVKGGE